MKIKKIAAMLLALVMIAACLTACGKKDEPAKGGDGNGEAVTWKVAVNVHPDTKWAEAIRNWSEKLTEETDGELTLDIHWNAELGAEADVLANVQTGSLDACQISFSLLAQYNEAWNVMELPFLFDDAAHMDAFCATEAAQNLFASFEDSGFVVPRTYLLGFRYPNMVSTPIESVASFKGITFRTMDNEVQMATLEALDATPITVPYSDVYNALKQGVADGWCCDTQGFVTTSSTEAAPYISCISLFPVETGLIFSKASVDKLSDEARETLFRLYNEEFADVMAVGWDETIELVDSLAEKGAIVNEVTDTQAFIDAVTPVWDDVAGNYDGVQELLDVINSVR